MRKRYQKGGLQKVDGVWIAQWWDDGHRRKRTLGRVSVVTKSDAQAELAAIVAPINTRHTSPSARCTFGDFVTQKYLTFYRRKWKRSTLMTNEDRVKHHLVPAFGERTLGSLTDEELQDFLEGKAQAGLSYSVVAHLRWDLRQILGMAVVQGYMAKNPAEQLFVPREAQRPEKRIMTFDEVKLFFAVLDLRERVIGAFGILAGLRPGEIFALKRSHVEGEYANVDQRIYRGEIDTPKTVNSKRWAALGDGLQAWLHQWLDLLADSRPGAWLFPSEKLVTPLSKDNCWRRSFLPRLKPVGLEWANFQVMRRTHSSLSDDLGIDPQVRADQMGHTVDVNQNKYTKSSMDRRREAVNRLEGAIGVS